MGDDYSDLHRVVSVDPSLDASNSVSAQNQKWLEKYRVVQQFMDNNEPGLLSGSIVIPDDLLDSIMLSGDSIAGLPLPPKCNLHKRWHHRWPHLRPQREAAKAAANPLRIMATATVDNKVDTDGKLSGASNAKGGQVRLCVNDAPDPNASAITIDKDGHFSSGTTSILKVIAGSKVVAEVVPAGQYGAISNEVIVGACTSTGSGNLAQPTPALNPLVANVSIVSGKLMGAVAGMVRVCVDNRQVAEAPIASNGTFTAALQEPLGQGPTHGSRS